MSKEERTDNILRERTLKVGEIRTLEKDMARLRFLEAEKERMIISQEVPREGIPEEEAFPLKTKEEEETEEKLRQLEEEAQDKERVKRLEEAIDKRRAEERKRLEGEEKRKVLEAAEERKKIGEEEEKKTLEVERGVVEEIRKKAFEEERKVKQKDSVLSELKEEENLKKEAPIVQEELDQLSLEKKPLERESNKLSQRKRELEEMISPILAREKEIEEKIALLEEQERQAENQTKQREIEKTRWNLEKKRKETEKIRWMQEKEIQQITKKLEDLNTKLAEIALKEEQAKNRIKGIADRIEEIRLERKKFNLIEELKRIPKQKEPIEQQKSQILAQKQGILATLQEISQKENEFKKEKQRLEEIEKTAKSLEEREEAEQKRWSQEEQIEKTGRERWKKEEEVRNLNVQIEEFDKKSREQEEREEKLKERIKEMDFALLKLTAGGKADEEGVERFEEKLPTVQTQEKEEEQKTKIETQQLKQGVAGVPEIEEVKVDEKTETERRLGEARKRVEALKRTIGIDAKRIDYKEPIVKEEPEETPKELQQEEEEAAARMGVFKKPFSKEMNILEKGPTVPLPPQKTEEALAETSKETEASEIPAEFFRPVLQKPSPVEKYLIRILLSFVILIGLGVLFTFWYWRFTQKKSPNNTPVTQEEPPPAVREVTPPEEESIPVSLIPTENSKVLEISKPEAAPDALSAVLKENLGENKLTRIAFKDTSNGHFLKLKDFFAVFAIKSPENFFDKFEENFTLFIYSAQSTNYLGFAAKIKDSIGFTDFIKSWEKTMETDFDSFLIFLGKKQNTKMEVFEETKYKDLALRFLSFPQKDFGICWTIQKDLLVFTFSGKTMVKIVDILPAQ